MKKEPERTYPGTIGPDDWAGLPSGLRVRDAHGTLAAVPSGARGIPALWFPLERKA